MDSFRTRIDGISVPFLITHKDQIFTIGSCFSENIAERLKDRKFKAEVNPFGILFNPFTIFNAFERMLNNRPYQPEDLIQVNDQWVSLDHHGVFSGKSQEETLDGINTRLENGRKALLQADVVFITLGSAWVYKHLERSHYVANCHKIPNMAFQKELLPFQTVHLILRHIPQFFASKKMNAQIVFTVSPVRHWKDGAIENSRSKAMLNAAVHEVVDEFDNCHYFPSYEYLMDDLRDYRFYNSDMFHPTPQAIEYVWEKFEDSFFSDDTRLICKELKTIIEAVKHKPMDPESNSFQRFVKKQIEVIDDIESRFDVLDLSKERDHFNAYKL